MSTEAIDESILIREFTRELHNKNAAVFVGAGLSLASGFVDWKGLLKGIIKDLHLDPDLEEDLVTIAQYHCNQSGGNRGSLTQTIFDHFSTTKKPTENHAILARLPIFTFWTTNYDRLIEDALKGAKKIPDVKYSLTQLAVTRQDRDVAVYKMHGDIEHPVDAIITKDDYEAYPTKMSAFVSALRGDLIEKTFLFLGFSFTDPNIDFILSRVRVQFGQNQRPHYCIQKAVARKDGEAKKHFQYRQLKQEYFIRDLKRIGVNTVLVKDYADITHILKTIETNFRRASVLISGAAVEYSGWKSPEAAEFLYDLSYSLAKAGKRIVTGFGIGVGSSVINGVLALLTEQDRTVSDADIVMRPFPQSAGKGTSLANLWTNYRKAMIEPAGIAIFVFGNRADGKGGIEPSSGMREEFDLCIANGVVPIPIGATGYMAKTLWDEVASNFKSFYPSASRAFQKAFTLIGDATTSCDNLLKAVHGIVNEIGGK